MGSPVDYKPIHISARSRHSVYAGTALRLIIILSGLYMCHHALAAAALEMYSISIQSHGRWTVLLFIWH